MDKSLIIGCATFNNLKYTKLFLESIKCSCPYEILIVDNGSTDDTLRWLRDNSINHIAYAENRGFSYAYNDAMDYALKDKNSLLLWCGNDIVFRPTCIDYLIQALRESDYEMFCANEVLNKEILVENEKALERFRYKYSFDEPEQSKLLYSPGGMNHSCIIRKKAVFDKVGYYDVGFYPAYFEDNDYARRCDLVGVKYVTVESAVFYHFWSRSIHEGGLRELNDRRFSLNQQYYITKWGGSIGNESYTSPFNSGSDVRISTRDDELQALKGFGVI